MVRTVLAVIVTPALLFMADQEFAGGHYTGIAKKALARTRSSIGI